MIEQRQVWRDYIRYLIANAYGSVQIEMHDEVQDWGGTAWIYALWVDEYHRLAGNATRLLNRAEEVAKEAGHRSVFLEWERHNTPPEVLEWYIRSGYKKKKQRKGYCLLEKQL